MAKMVAARAVSDWAPLVADPILLALLALDEELPVCCSGPVMVSSPRTKWPALSSASQVVLNLPTGVRVAERAMVVGVVLRTHVARPSLHILTLRLLMPTEDSASMLKIYSGLSERSKRTRTITPLGLEELELAIVVEATRAHIIMVDSIMKRDMVWESGVFVDLLFLRQKEEQNLWNRKRSSPIQPLSRALSKKTKRQENASDESFHYFACIHEEWARKQHSTQEKTSGGVHATEN